MGEAGGKGGGVFCCRASDQILMWLQLTEAIIVMEVSRDSRATAKPG